MTRLCLILLCVLGMFTAAQASDLTDKGFAPGVEATIFTERLRAADALLLVENGDVYALDTDGGRISVLADRGMDGRADNLRRLRHVFDAPTAMTFQDGQLYVADQLGVWSLLPDGDKRLIASLEKANIEGGVQLLPGDQAGRLVLGFTAGGTAKLIDLDIASGIALPRAEILGELLQAARLSGGTLWTSVALAEGKTRFSPELSDTIAPIEASLTDFVEVPASASSDASLIGVVDGARIAAFRMDFGTPKLPGRDIISRFDPQAREADNSLVGAISADARGLFVFDRKRRTLWCIDLNPQPSDLDVSPASEDGNTPDP